MKTKCLIVKNLYQSENEYGKGGILYGLFLASNIKNCIVIDESGILSQKTTFKGFDQNMVGLNFKNFLDLERADAFLGKSKLNWKIDLCGIRIPYTVLQCPQCDNDQIRKQCEIFPKKICFECEVLKTCKICLSKTTQNKFYSTESTKLRKLPENELGYMIPHCSCFFRKTFLPKIHLL